MEGMMLSWNSSTLATSWEGWLIGKDSDAGRDWGQEEKGTAEDEMAGWHHWLDGHEFEWTPGVGDGQGGLACCDSWGRKESDMTERLIWSDCNLLNMFSLKPLVTIKIRSCSVQIYLGIVNSCPISMFLSCPFRHMCVYIERDRKRECSIYIYTYIHTHI